MKKKSKNYYYHRRPKTLQERKANCRLIEDGERVCYGRDKRRPYVLDPWSSLEKYCTFQKTWKVKRNKQYHANGRGQRHEIKIEDVTTYYDKSYKFKKYCENHNIPYVVETIRKSYIIKRPEYKTVVVGRKPHYVFRYEYVKDGNNKNIFTQTIRHQCGWLNITEQVKTGNIIVYHNTREIGVRLIWWSNKDIGIQYILNI